MPKKTPKKPRKRKPSQWVRLKDARQMAETVLLREISSLAINFATYPDRAWTGEEIAEALHKAIAKRKKYPELAFLTEDELPRGHVKLQIPKYD